jgi:hypothetical protein
MNKSHASWFFSATHPLPGRTTAYPAEAGHQLASQSHALRMHPAHSQIRGRRADMGSLVEQRQRCRRTRRRVQMGAGAAFDISPEIAVSTLHEIERKVNNKPRYECRIPEGKRKRTSKKLSPALCTSTNSSSEPGVRMGSGASCVSCILDGWAYSEMTNAFIEMVDALTVRGGDN